MLVALMKVFIFLCILIIPLRGPSRRRENKDHISESTTVFSKYAVNEQGKLELMDKEGK